MSFDDRLTDRQSESGSGDGRFAGPGRAEKLGERLFLLLGVMPMPVSVIEQTSSFRTCAHGW